MKSLVVYDSLYGNTKTIAEVIGKILNAKIVNVKDVKQEMLDNITLLIIGCPIHGWKPSEPTANFLESLSMKIMRGMQYAVFDTRIKSFFSGDAADKINKQLKSLGGIQVTIPGKFIVLGKEGPLADGEIDRAKEWANQITLYESFGAIA